MIPAVDGLSAFGAATVAALVLSAYLVVGEPWVGSVLHRRFEALLDRGSPLARRWLYQRLLILEWGLAALVAGVVLVAPGVGWGELGLRWPDRAPGIGALIVIVLVLGLLVVSTVLARGTAREEAPPTALGSPSVLALVPRTPVERRLFAPVAVTAGFCEELLYRGLLLAVLMAVFPGAGTLVVVLVSAAAFGLAHAYQGVAGMLTTGVIGGLLAYTYADTGTLLVPILLHAAIDLRILFLPRDLLPPDPVR